MRYGKIVILGLLILSAIGAGFYLGQRKPAVGSEVQEERMSELRLKLEPRVLDLGIVKLNREIKFTARIRNYSQELIKLAKIEKSCGCTNVSLAKQMCQPGETVELKGMLIPSKSGRFRHLVRIIEENKWVPELILEVVGEAQASIKAFPESIVLNPSVFENKAVEQVIVIRNDSDERMIVRNPTGLPEGISVKIMDGEIMPKQETQIIVRAEPHFFLDTDLNLSFPTSHSSQEKVAVKVQLRPENGFTVMPNKIRFGVVSKRELEKSPVRLSLIGTGVKDVAVRQVVTPSFLRIAKESTRKGDRIEMEFVFSESLQGINLQGTIRIALDMTTKEPDQNRTFWIDVPISGLVRD